MLPSTSSRLRQGPTHVTDTGRCPTPCPNPIEVAQLGQLPLCCSRSGASSSSRVCSVLFPALRLSHAAVCAATKLLVCCSQDLSDLRTTSVLHPDWRGEPVVTRGLSTNNGMPSLSLYLFFPTNFYFHFCPCHNAHPPVLITTLRKPRRRSVDR